MDQSNAKYKDSVFRKIFNCPERIIDLIRYVIDDQDLTIDDISMVNGDVLLDYGFRNDIAVLCRNRLIIMLEHQSTINENMPLRYLFYIAKYYKSCIKGKQLYQSGKIKLPSPEFIVLYNGKQDQRSSWTQRLSKSFEGGVNGSLEVRVQWMNVRRHSRSKILKASQALNAYAVFVEQVEKGLAQRLKIEIAIKKALQYCILHGYLSEFFESSLKEVETVFAEEWNMNDALAVREAEGEARGEARGRIANAIENTKSLMVNYKLSIQDALNALNISPVDRPAILAAL